MHKYIYIYIYKYVCVCVCVWERERERERVKVKEREREKLNYSDEYVEKINCRKEYILVCGWKFIVFTLPTSVSIMLRDQRDCV